MKNATPQSHFYQMKLSLFLAAFLGWGAVPSLHADQILWQWVGNGTNNRWSNADNWLSAAGVPTNGDRLKFDLAGPGGNVLDLDLAGLTLSPGATNTDPTLTFTGNSDWTFGGSPLVVSTTRKDVTTWLKFENQKDSRVIFNNNVSLTAGQGATLQIDTAISAAPGRATVDFNGTVTVSSLAGFNEFRAQGNVTVNFNNTLDLGTGRGFGTSSSGAYINFNGDIIGDKELNLRGRENNITSTAESFTGVLALGRQQQGTSNMLITLTLANKDALKNVSRFELGADVSAINNGVHSTALLVAADGFYNDKPIYLTRNPLGLAYDAIVIGTTDALTSTGVATFAGDVMMGGVTPTSKVVDTVHNTRDLGIDVATGKLTFSGVLKEPDSRTGNANVYKNNVGIAELTGANTYHGRTYVNEGVLLVNNTSGSGTGSGDVIVGTVAGLDNAAWTMNEAANDDKSKLTITGVAPETLAALQIGQKAVVTWGVSPTTLDAIITGIDAANGKVILSQVKTDGTPTSSKGTITVQMTTATLAGHGRIDGNVTVNAGSHLTAGDFASGAETPTLSTSDQALNRLSIGGNVDLEGEFHFYLGSLSETVGFTQISLDGASPLLTLSGASFNLTGANFLNGIGDPDSGNDFWNSDHSWKLFDIAGGQGVTGLFQENLGEWAAGSFSLIYNGGDGNDIELRYEAIPEPAMTISAAAMGLLIASAAGRSRRRRAGGG